MRHKWLCIVLLVILGTSARAEDWPQYRHDAGRTAATAEQLLATLHLQWVRHLGTPKPAWVGAVRRYDIAFDDVYEPIVVGKRMFIGSNRNDSIMAFDVMSGRKLWQFFTDGPVRFAPVVHDGKVYAGSDDGNVYCLDAATGMQRWIFHAAPGRRNVLGNQRIISTWPIAGGPVLENGRLYFVAGTWPTMGIFVYCLDAQIGKEVWVNETTDAMYMMHPHYSQALSGLAPQGYLAIAEDVLVVPTGRARPAGFDKRTGKLLHYLIGARGGSLVAARKGRIFNEMYVYDARTGHGQFATMAHARLGGLVLTEEAAYGYRYNTGIVSVALADLKPESLAKDKELYFNWGYLSRDDKSRILKPTVVAGVLNKPVVQLKAGNHLYASLGNELLAFALSQDGGLATEGQHIAVDAEIGSVVAANGRLIVSTESGAVHCYATGEVEPKEYRATQGEVQSVPDDKKQYVRNLLRAARVQRGYAVALGVRDRPILDQLIEVSKLHVTSARRGDEIIDLVADERAHWDASGLYGARIAVRRMGYRATAAEFSVPKYVPHLIMVGPRLQAQPNLVPALYEKLHPYGGALHLMRLAEDELKKLVVKHKLQGAVVRTHGDVSVIVRTGGPKGAGSWTHHEGDAGRSSYSGDTAVHAPLGVLWYGGGMSGFSEYYGTHQDPPVPLKAGGRILIKGPSGLNCMDMYTGRLLWKWIWPDGDRNIHRPDASVRGGTHVLMEDCAYVNTGKAILRLDAATGEEVGRFTFLTASKHWGYVAVSGDALVAGAGDREVPDEMPKDVRTHYDYGAASSQLVVVNRHTMTQLWMRKAERAFTHTAVALGSGKLFCMDAAFINSAWSVMKKGQGKEPRKQLEATLLALDLSTGKELWKTQQSVFGSRISYSAEKDIIIQTWKQGVAHNWRNQAFKRVLARRGKDGSVLWDKTGIHDKATAFAIIGDDMFPTDTNYRGTMRTFDPLTGKVRQTNNLERSLGGWCANAQRARDLFMFRCNTVAYSDTDYASGSISVGGIKPGCAANMVPAGGIVAIPSVTSSGCKCSYQIQSSLGLIHEPDVEAWSCGAPDRMVAAGFGLNFGAPGDRLDRKSGTFWLDYPSGGSPSPLTIEQSDPRDYDERRQRWQRGARRYVNGPEELRRIHHEPAKLTSHRRHSLRMRGGGLKWVGASCVEGLRALTIKLPKPGLYTVRLHFAELRATEAGARVFDLQIQGRVVIKELDVASRAGVRSTLVLEFENVAAPRGVLELNLIPVRGQPLISGLEAHPQQLAD
jgi:outer membrane protein assembly factor BamB